MWSREQAFGFGRGVLRSQLLSNQSGEMLPPLQSSRYSPSLIFAFVVPGRVVSVGGDCFKGGSFLAAQSGEFLLVCIAIQPRSIRTLVRRAEWCPAGRTQPRARTHSPTPARRGWARSCPSPSPSRPKACRRPFTRGLSSRPRGRVTLSGCRTHSARRRAPASRMVARAIDIRRDGGGHG